MFRRLEAPFVLLAWRFWRRFDYLLFNFNFEFSPAKQKLTFQTVNRVGAEI